MENRLSPPTDEQISIVRKMFQGNPLRPISPQEFRIMTAAFKEIRLKTIELGEILLTQGDERDPILVKQYKEWANLVLFSEEDLAKMRPEEQQEIRFNPNNIALNFD